jgi:hypothetical protein
MCILFLSIMFVDTVLIEQVPGVMVLVTTTEGGAE